MNVFEYTANSTIPILTHPSKLNKKQIKNEDDFSDLTKWNRIVNPNQMELKFISLKSYVNEKLE